MACSFSFSSSLVAVSARSLSLSLNPLLPSFLPSSVSLLPTGLLRRYPRSYHPSRGSIVVFCSNGGESSWTTREGEGRERRRRPLAHSDIFLLPLSSSSSVSIDRSSVRTVVVILDMFSKGRDLGIRELLSKLLLSRLPLSSFVALVLLRSEAETCNSRLSLLFARSLSTDERHCVNSVSIKYDDKTA